MPVSPSNTASRHVLTGFARSLRRFPLRPALLLDEQSTTYVQLAAHAGDIAATLRTLGDAGRFVGILAARSRTAFAGVLGALLAGSGYLPLRPEFPAALIRHMCQVGGVRTLILDERALPTLRTLLPLCPGPLTLVIPDTVDLAEVAGEHPHHRFIGTGQLARGDTAFSLPQVPGDAPAALLFTSGTTGLPKGVPLSHDNLAAYLDHCTLWLGIRETDRVANFCSLDFAGGLHDVFNCFEQGACLCCPSLEALRMPVEYIRQQQLTVMLAVPSLVIIQARSGRLRPGSFPSLRIALLGGEALPLGAALALRAAAPGALLHNAYGMTETTVCVASYPWDDERSAAACEDGSVPLGWIFPHLHARVVGPDFLPVVPGEIGEVCVAGPQVTGRYLADEAQTRARFVHLPDDPPSGPLFYRTGDLVRQGPDGCLHYKGRVDHRVQVRGCRVELCGVESVLREAAGIDLCAVLPWPVIEGAVQGLVGLVCLPEPDAPFDERALLRACGDKLPREMVPSRIYRLAEMPLNRNGKIDRARLSGLAADLAGAPRLGRHGT